MTALTTLIFSGALIYWLGLITHQRMIISTGFMTMILVLLLMVYSSHIASPAILLLISGGLLAVALKYYPSLLWQTVGWTLFIIFALALGLRALPWFTPLETLQTTEHLFRFSPEKAVLIVLVPAMVLVPWSGNKRRIPARHPLLTSSLILLGTLAVVIPLALHRGFIEPGWAPHSLEYLGYWLAYNLIFTCIIEESFFRGILQTAFIRWFCRFLRTQTAQIAGIAVTALLFGLVHLRGGLDFAILAAIAGVGYGLVYEMTGKLHYAVLVHFAVNAVWMLAFSGA